MLLDISKLCDSRFTERLSVCLRTSAERERVGITREPCAEQRTTPCLVLLLPESGECPESITGKQCLLAISERRLEIQLGPYARRTSEGFLPDLLRCIRLGQYPRAIQLEHCRSSERRDTEVWYPYLREPTGYLPAQSGCRRLAGRRDAYPTGKLDDL